jgi:hypothetical protein
MEFRGHILYSLANRGFWRIVLETAGNESMIKIHAKFHTASQSRAVLGNVNRISFEVNGTVYILETSDRNGNVMSCQTGFQVPDKNAVVFDSEIEAIGNCVDEDFVNVLYDCWCNSRDGFNVFSFPMISNGDALVLIRLFTMIRKMKEAQPDKTIFRMKSDCNMFRKGNYYVGRTAHEGTMVVLYTSDGHSAYVPRGAVEG